MGLIETVLPKDIVSTSLEPSPPRKGGPGPGTNFYPFLSGTTRDQLASRNRNLLHICLLRLLYCTPNADA